MKILPYKNKESGEEALAIDATSALQAMQDLEEFNGTTTDRIVTNWYALKGQFREVILSQVQQTEPKEPEEEKQENDKPGK